jgi:DNA repair protein RecO (recombination protein O)
MSGPVKVEAIVLASLRYGETSKIVRLATRELGVQSAIAKGALRPKSRFAAALQPLSHGTGLLVLSRRSDLHLLTAFEVIHYPAGLGRDLARYAPAQTLAEIVLRFAPGAPHPEAFDLLLHALLELEHAPASRAAALGLKRLWQLVQILGFAPGLETCVLDGAPIPATGPLPFSAVGGGALCPDCARTNQVAWIPEEDRSDLGALLTQAAELPVFDRAHDAAHRRLFARYLRAQLGEDTALPALDFWQRVPNTHSPVPTP